MLAIPESEVAYPPQAFHPELAPDNQQAAPRGESLNGTPNFLPEIPPGVSVPLGEDAGAVVLASFPSSGDEAAPPLRKVQKSDPDPPHGAVFAAIPAGDSLDPGARLS